MVLVSEPRHKIPAHHKKRSGRHHKQTKQFSKTYWPYLPLFTLVVVGLAINSLWVQGQHRVLGYATDISATALLEDTNSQRAKHSEQALRINTQLAAAAQAKANDMVARNYWSHATPDGKQPWSFVAQNGYNYRAVGENLAYGFAGSNDTVSAWMASPEHRANVLDKDYQDVGFGITNAPSFQGSRAETVIVAMYGEPADSANAADTPQVLPAKHTIARVELLAGSTAWTTFTVAALAGTCIVIFAMRHALAWRRVVVKGEHFIINHRVLDVVMVGGGVAGFLLTRTSGMIH
ncbi:MAG TPA: CAP domain-containing protein [Nevskiaceae bacterium]|nr:CAP domain-containing protein [Nevskiaceae bacterium]